MEALMKAHDDGNFACGIFVDLQKAFDTKDHSILLSKLCHYGICGLANKWFQSYLADCKQFISIVGLGSNISSINVMCHKDLFWCPYFFYYILMIFM